MIKKHIKKTFILNRLLNSIKKKGKHSMSKNLTLKSFVNVSKSNNNDTFSKLLDNIMFTYILPFKIIKNKSIYKSIYTENVKSINRDMLNIIKNIRKNKKKISFDFYFKNEMYRLLNDFSSLSTIQKNNLTLFGIVRFYFNNESDKKSKHNKKTKNFILKNTAIKHYQNYLYCPTYYYSPNHYCYKKIKIIDKNLNLISIPT